MAVAATGSSLLFLHKSCGIGEATFYTCLAAILTSGSPGLQNSLLLLLPDSNISSEQNSKFKFSQK